MLDDGGDLSIKREEIDYPRILMRQLDRVGMASIMKEEMISSHKTIEYDFVGQAIKVLDCLMFPYQDDIYNEKFKKIKNDESGYDLLRVLMDLLHRRGLLLKEVIEMDAGGRKK